MSSAIAARARAADVRDRMERMYRPQAPIYDLTRKYYLVGRDLLVDGLDARPGERVLDLGCGTGRNLVRVARRWTGTRVYGVDAAAAMLEAARRKVERAGLVDRVALARADAEHATVAELFGDEAPLDHAVISYALSMMDEPLAAIEGVLRQLRPGGRLHVVDFGDGEGLPRPIRAGLTRWLAAFGVRHRPEIGQRLRGLATQARGAHEERRLLRGYAVIHRFSTARGS